MLLAQTGDLIMSANNCFGVMIGWLGNEKTSRDPSASQSTLKIGFTLLVSFFITRIWLRVLYMKNTIAGSKYRLARLLTAFETGLQ